MDLTPLTDSKKSKVLWVQLQASDQQPACFAVINSLYKTCVAKGLEEAARALAEDLPFLVFLETDSTLGGVSHFLQWMTRSYQDIPCLVVAEQLKVPAQKRLINSQQVVSIIHPHLGDDELHKILTSAEFRSGERAKQRRLLSSFREQNQQLEEMNTNLERLVKERTHDIEVSKSETEKKIKKIRSLIQFIKDLTIVATIDDLMILLREELKRFHQVGEPFLACQTSNYGRWILHYRTGRILERPTQNPWPIGLRIRINSKVDQQYLANEFSRPFQKVIAVPLHTKGGKTPLATLFIEHALGAEMVDEFIHFIGERLQTMSLALDRLLLDVELKRSSYLWECTFDNIEDPIAIFDDAMNVIRSNRKFQYLFGEEQSWETQVQLLGEKTNPVGACLKSKRPSVVACRVKKKFYDWHCYPIIFKNLETATSVVSHFVDMTVHRQLQSRLIHNEKMSAIGHLAGNIAHELNNPLTGIRSLTQVLINELPGNDALINDLKEVEAGAERSQKIITNLLEFSQDKGQRPFEKVELNSLIERTLPLLKSITSEHERSIILSEEELNVMAEPHLLQQVIFNLVNNACQAMDHNGELTITTKKVRVENECWARLQVQDTGRGIAKHLQAAIFDPFFTTKSSNGGTGLGLSMSKSVIESFGGRIEVDSEVGSGTTFYVYLSLV